MNSATRKAPPPLDPIFAGKPQTFAMLLHLFPVLLWLFAPGLVGGVGFFWVLIGGSLTAFINDRKLLTIFGQQEDV